MTVRPALAGVLVVVLACIAAVPAAAAGPRPADAPIDVIVVPDDDTPAGTVARRLAPGGPAVASAGTTTALKHVGLVTVTTTTDRLDELAATAGVAAVVEAVPLRLAASAPTGVARVRLGPDDHGRVGPVDADIAVLDTGVDAGHPDLTVVTQIDCSSGTCTDYVGGSDLHAHGTHVAGSAAADGTIVGTAPGARIHDVKVFANDGTGTSTALVAGLDWVAGHGGIEAVNLSLSCLCASHLDPALQAATGTGATVLAAAGNDGQAVASGSLAASERVVTVSAILDRDGTWGGAGGSGDDTFASYSNYGPQVDLAAPGTYITSTVPGGGYGGMSGTSMATPHVAGAAALEAMEVPSGPDRPATVAAALTGPDWSTAQTSTCGFTGGISDEPLLIAGGCRPPAAPAAAATAAEGQVTVSWQPDPDAEPVTSVTIHRDQPTSRTVTLDGAPASWTDTKVSAGEEHRYTVVTHHGPFDSPASAPVTATPPVPATPDAPTVSAKAAQGQVTLSWQPDPDADPVTAVTIRRDRPTARTVTLDGAATSWTDTKVSAGDEHRYTVQTHHGTLDSAVSAPVTATPPVPSTPDAPTVSATAAEGQVTVSWQPDPGADPVTAVTIRRDRPTSRTVTLSGSATSWTDTKVSAGKEHRYTVQTHHGTLDSAVSAPVTVTPPVPPAPPSVATPKVGVRVDVDTATVTFRSPDAVRYQVERSIDGSRYGHRTTTRRTSLEFGGLAWGSSHRFRVRAVDADGNTSAWKATRTVKVAAPPSFRDVAGRHTFARNIDWLAAAGITKGCNPPDNTQFCPDQAVTRGQMAAFLQRALDLPAARGGFADVPRGHTFRAPIAALAGAGITKGCNPPANTRFCPDAPVTRGQMAAFLQRALDLKAGSGRFADVPNGHTFRAPIAALAGAGITKGCNPPANTRFCPDQPVTRGQMAAFLQRALG